MIGHIDIGNYISVTPFNPPPLYLNGVSGAGNIRYNNLNNALEVYDGYTWQLYPRASMKLELTSDANKAIEWAISKMIEEEKIKSMCNHNAVRIAYENYKKAEEQLKTTMNLSQ